MTPSGGFAEDGLEVLLISYRGKAGPSWGSIGEARDEESGADTKHGTLRQTGVSEHPEGKQRAPLLTAAATCLSTPSVSCRMTPWIVILVTRFTPGRKGGGGTGYQ